MNLGSLLQGGARGRCFMCSSLRASRGEAVCGTQEHKEEAGRIWYEFRDIFCVVFSAVMKEVEQFKCKSTCETGEIGKPVFEDSG